MTKNTQLSINNFQRNVTLKDRLMYRYFINNYSPGERKISKESYQNVYNDLIEKDQELKKAVKEEKLDFIVLFLLRQTNNHEDDKDSKLNKNYLDLLKNIYCSFGITSIIYTLNEITNYKKSDKSEDVLAELVFIYVDKYIQDIDFIRNFYQRLSEVHNKTSDSFSYLLIRHQKIYIRETYRFLLRKKGDRDIFLTLSGQLKQLAFDNKEPYKKKEKLRNLLSDYYAEPWISEAIIAIESYFLTIPKVDGRHTRFNEVTDEQWESVLSKYQELATNYMMNHNQYIDQNVRINDINIENLREYLICARKALNSPIVYRDDLEKFSADAHNNRTEHLPIAENAIQIFFQTEQCLSKICAELDLLGFTQDEIVILFSLNQQKVNQSGGNGISNKRRIFYDRIIENAIKNNVPNLTQRELGNEKLNNLYGELRKDIEPYLINQIRTTMLDYENYLILRQKYSDKRYNFQDFEGLFRKANDYFTHNYNYFYRNNYNSLNLDIFIEDELLQSIFSNNFSQQEFDNFLGRHSLNNPIMSNLIEKNKLTFDKFTNLLKRLKFEHLLKDKDEIKKKN